MTIDNQQPLEDDDAFGQELAKLYRTALLDEQFQQQVRQDLQALPTNVQADLLPAEQVFVQEETLSAAAKARMLDMVPPCRQPQAAPVKPQSWWRKLLAADWASSLLPGPAFSIPAALMAGVLFGVLLPTLLPSLQQPEYVTRGGQVDKGIVTHPDTQAGEQNGITDEVRQNPQQWLAAIAELLRQGKVAQARAELQAFELQYPNYRP
ncbi:hypothetical protein VSS37_00525 [Candidatus Thiothrix sp. Deng01]|uniref:Anti sigma-E protein RseA N-terminal domain-containing protein n=1 Tax=Candidatus Thiothrix phosphatis TaxID=3112415 RepID=A0ABU6CRI6_9GAMM|nr:hypothetical protein [Candidatus Thiothrix sp. Deng01]MEB4589451.1 hypothetical protein [Candidatus Thiothrix sp. Deng01]